MSAVLNQPTEATRPTAPAATPASSDPHLSWTRKAVLFATPLILVVVAWTALPAGIFFGLHGNRETPSTTATGHPAPDGARLYLQHCAYCHGERGDGNGIAALSPRARYFGNERFKLAGTTNGVPTDDDLVRVVRHGIQGTAMPAFDEATLSPAEVEAICAHVRQLTWAGTYERIRRKTDPDEFDAADCAETTDNQCRPGPPLTVPASFPPPGPGSIARGRKVYEQTCMSCHGPDGRGDGPQVKDPAFRNENGTPARPRDLTSGVFKGGGDPARLYLRIRLGMPGTPMPASPASTVPDQDVFDLIHYVRSLSERSGPAAGDPAPAAGGS